MRLVLRPWQAVQTTDSPGRKRWGTWGNARCRERLRTERGSKLVGDCRMRVTMACVSVTHDLPEQQSYDAGPSESD